MPGELEPLFARFQSRGDPAALAAVYDRTAAELLRLALHLAGDSARAEDLVQATFLTAIEKADSFRAEQRLLPWLVGILQHHAKEARRREARRPEPERLREPIAQAPLDEAAHEEFTAALDAAIARLPAPLQPVLVLRLRHGLDPVDIAHALRRPPGTVRAQLARGLDRVRRFLPASFAPLLVGLLTPTRGLAAVRDVVLAQAGAASVAAVSATTIGGLLLMKKAIAVIVLAVAGLTTWGFWPPSPPSPEVGPAPAAAVAAAPEAAFERQRAEQVAAQRAELEAPPIEVASLPASGPITNDSRGSMVVRVIYADDRSPAAGVHVRLRNWQRGSEDLFDQRAVTGDDGTLLVTDLEPGPWGVDVDRGGSQRVFIGPGVRSMVTVTIPAGVAVRGVVVDQDQQPVAGARIWLSDRWSWRNGQVVTHSDERGQFHLRSVEANHYIGARARGRTPSALTMVSGEAGEELDVRLVVVGHGATVEGTVRDRQGKVIAGALVLVGRDDQEHRSLSADGIVTPDWAPFLCRTDAEGRYRADDVGLGPLPVQARAAGFGPARQTIETVADGMHRVDLTLEQAGTIAGKFVDANGKPLSGVAVLAFAADPGAATAPTYDEVMNNGGWGEFHRIRGSMLANGAYRVEDVPPGAVCVIAGKPNHGQAQAILQVRSGATVEWSPFLSAALQLSGRVVDAAGQPLQQWTVRINREDGAERTEHGPRYHWTQTDQDGKFSFDRRPSVPHEVIAYERLGKDHRKRAEQAGVLPGAPILLMVPEQSRPDGALVGRVLDGGGRPSTSATVWVWCAEHELSRHEGTDDAGAFALRELPAGRYWVRVTSEDHAWLNVGFRDVGAQGATQLGDLRLQAGARLRGRLMAADRALLQAARLAIAGDAGEAGSLQIHEDGYRSSPLAPGNYTLELSGPGIASQRRKLTMAATDQQLDVHVLRGVEHRMRITASPTVAAQRWVHVMVGQANEPVATKSALRTGDEFSCTLCLRPGHYDVTVFSDGGKYKAEGRIEVSDDGSGRPQETVLRLQ